MTIYTRLTATAARMLAPVASGGKGALVTITSPGTPGGYNPMTDTVDDPGAPTTQTGSGVEDKVSTYSVANSLAESGDVTFHLSAMTYDENGRSTGIPLVQPVKDRDVLTKADGDWAIKEVDPVKPAGVAVMYTLRLRRGP